MSEPKPTKPLAVVTIDHVSYLLPSADALRLMTLMQNAVRVDEDYGNRLAGGRAAFIARGTPEVEVKTVRADQITAPERPSPKRAPAGSTLALAMDRSPR